MEIINDKVEIKDEDIQENDFTPEELEDDTTDWKAKATELKGIAKRRGTQLGKVRMKLGEYETKIKEFTSEPPKPQDKNKPKEEDYGLLTYLAQNGIETDEDIEWANQVKEQTGKSFKELFNTVYFQKELKERKEARAVKEAIPSGTNRSGGSARDSVEYWLAKGELPPEDQVELRRKVVDAKYAKDTNAQGKFTDHPIVNFPSGM